MGKVGLLLSLLFVRVIYGLWPMFQHDPKHRGRSAAMGAAGEPAEVDWIALEDPISAPPTVRADNIVYVVTLNGKVIALNNGEKEWEKDIGATIKSSPAIGGGMIYFGAQDKYFYALDASSGEISWKEEVGIVNSSPCFWKNTLYFAADTSVFTYSARGSQKWRYAAKGTINSSPVVDDNGGVYFQTYYGDELGVYAVDKNGDKKWFSPTYGGIASPSIGEDGNIYVGDQKGIFYAMDSETGAILWQNTLGTITSTPAIGKDGTIYIGSKEGGILYALDPLNGGIKGRSQPLEKITASAVIDGAGRVYIGAYDKRFYCFLPDMKYKWHISLGEQIEVGAAIGPDGTIYVGTVGGVLYALPSKEGITESLKSHSQRDRILSVSPNPSKAGISIKWLVTGEGPISLRVYNASGRLVRNLHSAKGLGHRVYSVVWNGKDSRGVKVSSGVYFICLKTDKGIDVRRVILIR